MALSMKQTLACKAAGRSRTVSVKALKYADELVQTAGKVASKGRGILAMDESNATCGKRLQSIGLENTEDSRRAYRELLVTTPGLGKYISGAILFEETLFQKPEVLLDGEHDIDACLEVQEAIWAETFKYLADNKVLFEGILLKPAMVTPGADAKVKASPETVASYTLKMLRRRVPPAVPGIMFLSGGQSELEATLNLNAMNQSPNPWHVSFSYARALQNSVLKSWQGKPENLAAGQEALLKRAKANSDAQLGQYDASGESAAAGERTYEKGYKY
ncbi:fructose-bisphosphate aldolase, class I [Monoraphidium neglectum]|uniref:fructose-bisphosphate aldolase n=1 Tax=Monoraphidium neglectum TaxID=145388 RepID=A0A0D2NQE2_9CHLO|nr:fructose-bisphosphate aldolase, class I [Monoraphidium neglectum]KIZ06551.1 fructose-bisphosphate aldolase, class I [Monoraphidium neglectum]|eukprot:XP_013905570.1 fructose-bisphosphate aldolase, class I [Monoraphidium neglectum]